MATAVDNAPMTAEQRKVIFASSLGTVFEWYDFYLYGSLAPIIARQFFSGLDPQSAFIFALLAFAAGFIVRPFGAIFFGRLGDMIGRKYTFLVTILLMGLSTFIVGLLPNYASIGVAAFPEHGRDRETLLRMADETMYDSKRAGKNRVFNTREYKASTRGPSAERSALRSSTRTA